MMLVAMALHNQKSQVVPYFSCLDLRDSMVPFLMPEASCVADINANGIT